MDGWVDGQKGRRMNGWTERKKESQTDRQSDALTEKQTTKERKMARVSVKRGVRKKNKRA